MIETLRRYWIALLVLVLVGLHASIIAVIRMQASQARVNVSCEIDLGDFTVYQGDQGRVDLKVHAIIPQAIRLQSKAVFETRQFEIHQNIEETLRQLDPTLLKNPYMDDVKEVVMDVLIQTIGAEYVEKVLISNLKPNQGPTLVFTKAPRRRYDKPKHQEHGGHGEHGEAGEEEEAGEEGEEPAHGEKTASH